MTVYNSDRSVAYSGVVHDTGAGWDENHRNVLANKWIDIWIAPNPNGRTKYQRDLPALSWGKQWIDVRICYPQ